MSHSDIGLARKFSFRSILCDVDYSRWRCAFVRLVLRCVGVVLILAFVLKASDPLVVKKGRETKQTLVISSTFGAIMEFRPIFYGAMEPSVLWLIRSIEICLTRRIRSIGLRASIGALSGIRFQTTVLRNILHLEHSRRSFVARRLATSSCDGMIGSSRPCDARN